MTNSQTSEADMGYVRDFVQKIAEALVSATELPKQIEAIQRDMTSLSSDLERTKARNIELDTMLADTRRQRDEAEQALSQVRSELAVAQTDTRNASVTLDHTKAELETFRGRIEALTKERDDYGLKHMAAEDRASEAEGKLKKLREALGMSEPETKPEPPKPAEPAPPTTPYPQPVNPPQAEQAIPNSPKRIYEGDFGFNEAHYSTEQYDSGLGRYYRTA